VLQTVGVKTFPCRETRREILQADAAEDQRSIGKSARTWYAVHHGYEVQICDDADPFHRTGAIYSLSKADTLPAAAADGWRTMVITLEEHHLVDVDGKRVTNSSRRQRRAHRAQVARTSARTQTTGNGYVGLQNHDPGDVVHFREVSVRPLEGAK